MYWTKFSQKVSDDMKEWKKFRITTTAEAEEAIIAILNDLEIYSVEIEDNIQITEAEKEALFINILPELPDDNTAYITFYIDEDMDDEKLLKQIGEEIESLRDYVNVGSGEIEKSQTKEEDWINNWKEFFKPFTVGDVYITPTWIEEGVPKDKISIKIDPGTSFGTGMHETTQLAIRQVSKYLKKDDWVVDIGCGSGILSILSLKLGASYISAIDVDPIAVDASVENMQVNEMDSTKYQIHQGNLLEDTSVSDWLGTECYDVVVANILADVLIPLFPHADKILKPGGLYITSGIIADKADEVEAALYKQNMELVDLLYQGDWVSIVARKKYRQ